MEVTGKLIDVLEAQTGTSARGEWKKQEFIVETQEQFPKKICIANWNDKIDIGSIKTGDTVTLSINIESREFNGRWYTDVKAWKMAIGANADAGAQGASDMPPTAPPPNIDDAKWEENDDTNDLPF